LLPRLLLPPLRPWLLLPPSNRFADSEKAAFGRLFHACVARVG
jgi:hypothetical protein